MKRAVLLAVAVLATGCTSQMAPMASVPAVVGLPYSQALERFEGSGLCVGSVSGFRSGTRPLTVLAQMPRPGVVVGVLTGVGIEVSKGRARGPIADRLFSSSRPCDRLVYTDGPCNTAGPVLCHDRRLRRSR